MFDAVTAGQVLGRYELLLPIAQGGMASVWAARLKGTRGFQKMVAIKTMLPGLVDDLEFERMFLDEASLASQVHHPHVIEIHDLGEQDRVLYIVMEWVDGEPLSVILKYAASRGGIPLPIAVHMGIQACRGLHAAHELRDDTGAIVGLVHRDVSPQNVLVTYDGVVKVVDFGVAKATNRASGETRAGQLKGKIAYMSPEQLRGDRIDRRADVFAMGIMLYMMTTGRHPFRGDDEPSTIKQISSEEPAILPSTLVANYPVSLEQVVMQALAKDPAKRYPTANDIVIALGRALPPSTDEEVAAFLRALLPDRLEKRKLTIKSALDAADRRELSSSTVQQQMHSEGSDAETKLDGLISNHNLTPSTDASLPGALTGQELLGLRSRAPQRGRLARTIVSLSLVGALVAIAGAAFLRARTTVQPPVVAAPTEAARSSRDDAAPVMPSQPAPLATAPATSESAAPPPSAVEARTPPPSTGRGRRQSLPAPAPSSKPKRPGVFVSPIRNPGF